MKGIEKKIEDLSFDIKNDSKWLNYNVRYPHEKSTVSKLS